MPNPSPGDGFDRFSRTAREFSAGPLGIIALFLVLVYGIAGLVLGTAYLRSDREPPAQLVWFIVLFPELVLVVFAWLVTQHHEKLYPPHDKPTYFPQRATTPAAEPTAKKPPGRPKGSKNKPKSPAPPPPTELTGGQS